MTAGGGSGGDGKKEGGGAETEVVTTKIGSDRFAGKAGAGEGTEAEEPVAAPVEAVVEAAAVEVATPPKKRGMLAAIADAEARAAKKKAAATAAAGTQLGLGVAPAATPTLESASSGELLPSTMPVFDASATSGATSAGELPSATVASASDGSATEPHSVSVSVESGAETGSETGSGSGSGSEASTEWPSGADSDAEPATVVADAATAAAPLVVSPASTAIAASTAAADTPVTDSNLRDALGVSSSSAVSTRAPRRAREDFDDDRIASELSGGGSARRRLTIAGVVLAVGVVGAAVIAGYLNHQRYVLVCGTDSVVAKRGRSFPPWGEYSLDGAQWKPVTIPAAAECRDREAGSEPELSSWYLDLLVEQASLRLTARKVVDVDLAASQLEQALLLARAPERRTQRRDVERLLGDVEYWRAVEKLRAASDLLAEAAKQFEEAAQKQPKHVTDAPARAQQLRRFLEELEGRITPPIGPNAPILPVPPSVISEPDPDAPPATSATPPSEPAPSIPTLATPSADAGPSDAAPSAAEPVDAGAPASDAATGAPDAAPAAPPPPPANPSAGGVLL